MAKAGATACLYERNELLALAQDACARARDGEGSAIFVSGDAGLGKTALLEHLASRTGHFLLGRGSGAPGEGKLAYSVVMSALAELRGDSWLAIGSEPAEPVGTRGSRFYGTLRSLESLGRPALILLDDLHWADMDSLELLAFVCRRVVRLPVVVVGTLRRWPTTAHEIVSELVSSGKATLQRLQPLSQHACEQLLGDLTGGPPEPSLTAQIWHTCAGNPLLVHQVARSLETETSLPSLGTLDAATQLLLSRFAGTSTRTLGYARVASVFGNRFHPELVRVISDMSVDEADRSLLALCGAGLVDGDGAGCAKFVHPLFRQILYQDLPAPMRTRMHASAMRALLANGASTTEAAAHAVLGGAIGDLAAIEVLTSAGRSALNGGGVETAVAQLTAAVELAGTNASADLLLLLSAALNAAGRPAASTATAEQVLGMASATQEHRVQGFRLLAHAAFVAGRPRDAFEQFQEARAAAAGLDRIVLLDTLLDAAFTLGTAATVPTLLAFASEARGLACPADGARQALAEVAWGSVAAVAGDPGGLDAVLAASDAASRHPGGLSISWTWRVDLARMNVARQAERYEEACQIYNSGSAALDRAGDPLPILTMAIVHADTLKRLGRLLEAKELLGRSSELVELVPVGNAWCEIARADVDQELGQPVSARCAAIASSLGSHLDSYPLLWLWLWAVQGDSLVDGGHPDLAADLLARCRPLAERAGVRDPLVVPWARSAVEAAVFANRVDQAEAEVAWISEAPTTMKVPGYKALLSYSRALVSWRTKAPEAEAQFLEALSWLETTTLPLFSGRVLLAYGRYLRQSSRQAEARPLLARALRIAETCSAEKLSRQARDELRAAGGRRRRRDEPPGALTAQELRIAGLAAEGRTNSEIGVALYVSARTVESHLGHIYLKLGISSRRELRNVPALWQRPETEPGTA